MSKLGFGWKYIGSGRKRAVYLLPNGRNVIKIPLSEDGIHDNYMEAFRYSNGRKEGMYVQYARCRLLGVLLIMEYVAPIDESPYNLGINWVYSVDSGQVGYTKQGKLVAYDFGN